jgi:anti-anti-sigma factor
MPEVTRPVRWIGQQAVVTLPRNVDSSNAGHIREQLLQVVNRGAAVLVADLAATVSCDYSGTEAITRAYQRAVASGTDLRLVVAADVVRRAFCVNGLHRLITIYPTLDAALAPGRGCPEPPHAPATAASAPAVPRPRPPASRPAADPDDGTTELLNRISDNVFSAAMSLRGAVGLPRDAIAARIVDTLCTLDDTIREMRAFMPADQNGASLPNPARWRSPDIRERTAEAVMNAAFLRQRLVQRAHALHAAAADTAALLEQRADLVGEPRPVDYPTEIKHWRNIADRAEEMAKRWEQLP